MLEYVHFVPGRLRLKLSELRSQSGASEAEACIKAIPGVTRVAANPATGSLTITFGKELPLHDLWQRLREKEFVSGRIDAPCAVGPWRTGGGEFERFGRAITTALLDAVVQHSAQALVRALL